MSFDGRQTWKKWNGTAFVTVDITTIQTNGMDNVTTVNSLINNWNSTLGPTVDFAIGIITYDQDQTPSIGDIQITARK